MENKAFKVVVMGCTGGPRENNISGYLVAPYDKPEWVSLDAGTLLTGIECALEKNSFGPVTLSDPGRLAAGQILQEGIKAYLISHAHLDHIAGLVLNSPIDTPKAIVGIDSTIDNIRDHIFNGVIWPNCGNEGVEPMLNRYQYLRLPLRRRTPIPHTDFFVEAYLLSHPRGYPSTAFLVEYQDQFFLYIGDTSADSQETEKHLAEVWKHIAPLIRSKKLKGIFLECSFSHFEIEGIYFGHLNTHLWMREMEHLRECVGGPLEGLKMVITHRKESIRIETDPLLLIEQELKALNTFGLHLIFPQQGEVFYL